MKIAQILQLQYLTIKKISNRFRYQFEIPINVENYRKVVLLSFCIATRSVADPWYFAVNPNPRIHASE
jgi:hypothetical protein